MKRTFENEWSFRFGDPDEDPPGGGTTDPPPPPGTGG